MINGKKYLSVEDVAKLLDVNYQLIYRLVRSGELPAARVGKVYRIPCKDLERYLEKSKSRSVGGVCSSCGKAHLSKLSLIHECRECGQPVCMDCWTRLRKRTCKEHDNKGKGNP